MKNRKVFLGIIGVLGLGFVVFNNFDSTIQAVQLNGNKILPLSLALITSIIYAIHNREDIFK